MCPYMTGIYASLFLVHIHLKMNVARYATTRRFAFITLIEPSFIKDIK